MNIRKYEGSSEKEVFDNIKEELGLDALVLNIKKIQPKGLLSFFRKPTVQVTVACDKEEVNDKGINFDKKSGHSDYYLDAKVFEENREKILRNSIKAKTEHSNTESTTNNKKSGDNKIDFGKRTETTKKSKGNSNTFELEEKLNMTQEMLGKAMERLSVASQINNSQITRRYGNSLLQSFYEELINQGVSEIIAADILDEIDLLDDREKIDINLIVKIVYNKVIDILGKPHVIDDFLMDSGKKSKKNTSGKKSAKTIVFMGSTGVGKTTTIAKLSADFIFNKKKKVSLITADTYRIAAVEQLKTYADILGVDVEVVYNRDDLNKSVKKLEHISDIIMVDTAGRSHKNTENFNELCDLLKEVSGSDNYLVLSATTKYEDLLSIIDSYEKNFDFNLIFTKLDETMNYGSILNVCYATGKCASYITTGQNVPDDIEAVKPEKLAKKLLGLGEND